ncbi:unnamed protein product (mitochondrion) [Plasmodiophora brassicae]|uniref:Uncharacterized protein n=1 Tax=Plasmodiophora brassicae TaxID=37360 RepID=A0A0G4J5N4_PLABS|nr:hypothetical protein PBRA_002847 [Plasmodiophora brassicae]SPQ94985.1 unnamed protein product [Plasmodiophora brassicae]
MSSGGGDGAHHAANRDEAARCLEIAAQALASGDHSRANRLLDRAERLDDTLRDRVRAMRPRRQWVSPAYRDLLRAMAVLVVVLGGHKLAYGPKSTVSWRNLGTLPGDIYYRSPSTSIFIPITTTILIAVLLQSFAIVFDWLRTLFNTR